MGYESTAQSSLIDRITGALEQRIRVFVLITGGQSAYQALNPHSAAGVLSFDLPNGNTMRVLESSITGIIEELVD